MLLIFLKKFLFGPIGHFGPENDTSSKLWNPTKDFLRIFYNETGQEVHENYINGFHERNSYSRQMDIGPKIMHSHNCGSTARSFFRFCTIKETKRQIKIKLIVFLEKILFRAIGPF